MLRRTNLCSAGTSQDLRKLSKIRVCNNGSLKHFSGPKNEYYLSNNQLLNRRSSSPHKSCLWARDRDFDGKTADLRSSVLQRFPFSKDPKLGRQKLLLAPPKRAPFFTTNSKILPPIGSGPFYQVLSRFLIVPRPISYKCQLIFVAGSKLRSTFAQWNSLAVQAFGS